MWAGFTPASAQSGGAARRVRSLVLSQRHRRCVQDVDPPPAYRPRDQGVAGQQRVGAAGAQVGVIPRLFRGGAVAVHAGTRAFWGWGARPGAGRAIRRWLAAERCARRGLPGSRAGGLPGRSHRRRCGEVDRAVRCARQTGPGLPGAAPAAPEGGAEGRDECQVGGATAEHPPVVGASSGTAPLVAAERAEREVDHAVAAAAAPAGFAGSGD